MGRRLAPVHPGEVLREEFLIPLGISQYRLAKDIGVPPRRINEIVHGSRAVSADTALRLARYLGTSERFWLNLQAQHDLDVEHDRVGDRIEREVMPRMVGSTDRAGSSSRHHSALRPGSHLGTPEAIVPTASAVVGLTGER